MACEFLEIDQVEALKRGNSMKETSWLRLGNVCKAVTEFSNNLGDIKQSEATHISFSVLMDLAQLVRAGNRWNI